MGLRFGDRRWHDEATGTVSFPAFAGATRIACGITDEALKTVFGAGGKDTELVGCFDRCRGAIEAAALRKFDTSGEGRKLVLVSIDFPVRTPAKQVPKANSGHQVAAMLRHYRASGASTAANQPPSLIHQPEEDSAAAQTAGEIEPGAAERR